VKDPGLTAPQVDARQGARQLQAIAGGGQDQWSL